MHTKKKSIDQRCYNETLCFNIAYQQYLGSYSFFYPGDAIIFSQIGILKNLIRGLQRPYFMRFYVRGIGYKVWPFYFYRGLRFRIGLNHKSLYLFPSEIIGRGRKYKFVLSSLNYHQLKQAAVHVVSLKTPDPYRVKGIRFLNDNKLPKPRKEKRR
jgi:ribosomal protein L6P/L9E